ncbi:MAG: glycerophosphodiester phosphodiesterase family protein [Chitinophagaceae bacterium]
MILSTIKFRTFCLGLLFTTVLDLHSYAQQKISMIAKTFDTEAHRGGRGLMPENTIPAMLHAVDLGVMTLEMDAMITSDKKVILSHDPYFNHEIATKPDGSLVTAAEEKNLAIYGMTYEQTRKFDVGMRPHPKFPQQQHLKVQKPLLSELIDSVEAHCKKKGIPAPFYNIETKSKPESDNTLHPAPEEFVDLLMAIVNQKGIAKRTIIQSFDFRTLQIMHKKFPKVQTAMLIELFDKRTLDQQIQALGFKPTIYSPENSLVNASLVEQCHALGIRILPWTVNDKASIEAFKKLGVDGIISDYPNLFFEK